MRLLVSYGHVPVVPTQTQVEGQTRADAPVVLEVRGEVLEVELARVAGGSRHAECRRLEDAHARVVPEQHVGDAIARESDVERVVAEEPGGEIALQPPAAIVDAEVQRVAPSDPRRGVADVPHRLIARGVGVDRAAGPRVAVDRDARTLALVVRNVREHAGHIEEVHVRLRARNAALIRARVHAAHAELVDERVPNRPAVGDLPVPGVLHEDAVAGFDHVPGGRVLIAGLRVAEEHAAEARPDPDRHEP